MTAITFYKQRLCAMIFKCDFEDIISELHQVSVKLSIDYNCNLNFVTLFDRMLTPLLVQLLSCAQIRNSGRYWRCHEDQMYKHAKRVFMLVAYIYTLCYKSKHYLHILIQIVKCWLKITSRPHKVLKHDIS